MPRPCRMKPSSEKGRISPGVGALNQLRALNLEGIESIEGIESMNTSEPPPVVNASK